MDNNKLKQFVYFFTSHRSSYGFCIHSLTQVPTIVVKRVKLTARKQ